MFVRATKTAITHAMSRWMCADEHQARTAIDRVVTHGEAHKAWGGATDYRLGSHGVRVRADGVACSCIVHGAARLRFMLSEVRKARKER